MIIARLSTMTSCLINSFEDKNIDAPVFVIEKNDVFGTEEISLKVQHARGTVPDVDERHYQLGTANFESISSGAVILGIVQNCSGNFEEFCVFRIGPKSGQSSREIYKLDKATGHLVLKVTILTPIGITVPIVRIFRRVDPLNSYNAGSVKEENAVNRLHSDSAFSRASIGSFNNISPSIAATVGWKIYEFWPSNILTASKISMVKAVKITTPSVNSNAKQQEQILWSNQGIEATSRDELEKTLVSIARRHGNRVSDGEEIIEFVMLVTIGTSDLRKRSWYTSHRFKEFDALRQFIVNQDPCNKAFLDQSSKFPSKVIIGIAHRQSALLARVQGLEQFMTYFLSNARYMRQNSVDAVCSFLQIPEHLAEVALLAETARAPKPIKPPKRSIFGSISTSYTATDTTTTAARSSKIPKSKSAAATSPINVGNNSPGKGTPSSSRTTTPATVSASAATSTTTPTTTTILNQIAELEVSHEDLDIAMKASSDLPSKGNISTYGNGGKSSRAVLLSRMVSEGILVVKHGRSGAPKKRVLKCDPDLTILYWQSPADAAKEEKQRKSTKNVVPNVSKFEQKDDKFVRMDAIQSIRMGTEIDPSAPQAAEAQEAMDAIEDVDAGPPEQKMPSKRRSTLFGKKSGANAVQFGTATLRRNCSEDDELSLCFSLIMSERTFDVQCLNKEDFDFLFYNLKEL